MLPGLWPLGLRGKAVPEGAAVWTGFGCFGHFAVILFLAFSMK